MNDLLEVTEKWANRCGFDKWEKATAVSLAWYLQTQYSGPPLPNSHWARQAVRATRNGRDLPDCAISPVDAMNFAVQDVWQGAGMLQVKDLSPGPDVLVEHSELLETILSKFTEIKREVVNLKSSGMQGKKIAEQTNLSEGRVSQILREVVDKFRE